MPIILIEQDPFVEDLASADSHTVGGIAGNRQNNVRRPVGTIARKEMFAHIQVRSAISSNPNSPGVAKPISLLNSSAVDGISTTNHNFCISSFNISFQEKSQIVQTFGADHTFFYGQKPVIAQVSGYLYNTRDFNWKNEWLSNYEKFLRGTRCVEMEARVYLAFEDLLIAGYILQTGISLNADMPDICPFGFGMLVTNYVDLSRYSPREISENFDQGYNLTAAHARRMEYEKRGGGTNAFQKTAERIQYVDYSSMKVKAGSPGSGDNYATLDSKTTAWWLRDPENALGALHKSPEDAMREIGIRKYMEDNDVDRATAIDAESSGKVLFSKKSQVDTDLIEALSAVAKNKSMVI